ncbi:unnamed protein product [Brassica napus]|uniref:(rape) hypothetical protein n=1 Tax=Brassica napus TaxID=3708 RepID=A0A816I980_BRANA|nr:unnamed protein product [Brassica napus]
MFLFLSPSSSGFSLSLTRKIFFFCLHKQNDDEYLTKEQDFNGMIILITVTFSPSKGK